ncbi:rieske [2Fe-2S] domain protein, partial [Cooperia oncophora]
LKGVYRERQITRLAKLRRIGELPPVYPNGWYCIAESDELKPKAVREVTIFGKYEMTIILISVAVTTLFIYLIYYALRPCNRIRKLGDLGLLLGDPELKGVYRERQITRLAKLRRIGELPPVYPNGWYCIAESDELKPKGCQFLTLIRSESGQVHLIDSYCPHLGANFNVGGKVVDDNCVQCPFHGWVFSGETGKCTRIPYDNGTIPEQAKVAVWPVLERNQHIYVWYHCDGNEPEWDIPEIDEITNGEWTYGGRTEHEIMCHCQEIPENGADIAHLNYLHLTGPNRGNNLFNIDLDNTNPVIRHIWDGKWAPQTGEDTHLSVMHLDQYMTFAGFKIPLTSSRLRAEQVNIVLLLVRTERDACSA